MICQEISLCFSKRPVWNESIRESCHAVMTDNQCTQSYVVDSARQLTHEQINPMKSYFQKSIHILYHADFNK